MDFDRLLQLPDHELVLLAIQIDLRLLQVLIESCLGILGHEGSEHDGKHAGKDRSGSGAPVGSSAVLSGGTRAIRFHAGLLSPVPADIVRAGHGAHCESRRLRWHVESESPPSDNSRAWNAELSVSPLGQGWTVRERAAHRLAPLLPRSGNADARARIIGWGLAPRAPTEPRRCYCTRHRAATQGLLGVVGNLKSESSRRFWVQESINCETSSALVTDASRFAGPLASIRSANWITASIEPSAITETSFAPATVRRPPTGTSAQERRPHPPRLRTVSAHRVRHRPGSRPAAPPHRVAESQSDSEGRIQPTTRACRSSRRIPRSSTSGPCS